MELSNFASLQDRITQCLFLLKIHEVRTLAKIIQAGIGCSFVVAIMTLPHFTERIVAYMLALLCVHLIAVINISS